MMPQHLSRLWRCRIANSLVFILVILLPVRRPALLRPADTVAGKPEQPIRVELTASAPSLGEPVALSFRVTPMIDAPDIEVGFSIPAGVEHLGGSQAWQGSIAQDETRLFEAEIAFPGEGDWTISAWALTRSPDGVFASEDVLFFHIREGGSIQSHESPLGVPVADTAQVIDTGQSSAQQGVGPLDGFVVQGCFQYQDKAYDHLHGFTGVKPMKPIRRAWVEVLDKEDGADVSLGSTTTDELGGFVFYVDDNDDGPGEGGRDIYVRLKADNVAAQVQTPGGLLYTFTTKTWTDWGGGLLDIGTLSPSTSNGVYNILDVLLDGYQFVDGFTTAPDKITARWESGGTGGTYYDSNLDEIYVLGDVNDPDEYDDDILLHEYGHFVMDKYAHDKSLGGTHRWTSTYDNYFRTRPRGQDGGPLILEQSKQLAWSEGWAHFFSCAVRNDPHLVDNTKSTHSSVDLESPGPTARGSDNEGAVAGALWDVFDAHSDGRDHLGAGADEIWDVFDAVDATHRCVLQDVWDGWFDKEYGYRAEMCAIFNDHEADTRVCLIAPTPQRPAFAGPSSKPAKIVIEVVLPSAGLKIDSLAVQVGGKNGTIVTLYEGSVTSVLEVMPPAQTANGLYDLAVTAVQSAVSTGAVRYAATNNVDAILVIDRSGSMASSNYMEPAKAAAKTFVDLMHDDDQIGVISFSNDADVNYGLTTVSPASKAAAKTAIDAITADDRTSIGSGLQQGQGELTAKGDAAHPWSIVLLSDGYENASPYVSSVLPAIMSTKTVVHTVALGPASDQALLMDIASKTGGTFSMAAEADCRLGGIYSTIAGAVSGQQVLFSESGAVREGAMETKRVAVDATVFEATFSVSWSNSASTLDLTLIDPDGNPVNAATAASDPNTDYVAGPTYAYYRIQTPSLVAGVWKIRIAGGSIAASGGGTAGPDDQASYTAMVAGQTGLTMHVYLDRPGYLTTESIQIAVSLSDEQPILGAVVRVEVVSPSAAVFSLPLYDSGTDADGQANDGVYGNTLPGSQTWVEGTYLFRALAVAGSGSGTSWSRYGERSLYVAQHPDPRCFVYLPLALSSAVAGSEPANDPPFQPTAPQPADGALDQSTRVDQAWSGGDPDADPVFYDVYLEADDETPDELVCDGVTGTLCRLAVLAQGKHYYWQVVAKDARGGVTAGPVWQFTTGILPGWYEVGIGSAIGGGISDDDGNSSYPSLSIAPDGTPYVAWYGYGETSEEIYIRRWSGSSWQEVGAGSASGGGISDDEGASWHPSLAIAPDGTPYVAWHNYEDGDAQIYVRRWSGSSWQEVGAGSASGDGISNNGTGSWSPSLAVAPDGAPYVAWWDFGGGDAEIYVRRWVGGSWQEVGAGSASGGGISDNVGSSADPSLVIAPDGTPYIAWRDGSGGDDEIYVRRRVGGSWQEVGAGSASGGGISDNAGNSVHPAMAVAPDGTPYVTWFDNSSGSYEIYVRRWVGGSWQEVGAGSASGGGISGGDGSSVRPSLAIAPDGTPCVAWRDDGAGNNEIYARCWDGSDWQAV
ncbi:MAG: VWA domain-containing protein, partial [Anaerolineae bacterium]|nr:VWA domain-containing protein [Anaerolineae bacterium]